MKSAYHPSIERDNASFGVRVDAIRKSREGKASLASIRRAKRFLATQYRKAALAHWKERGLDASTGYGCVPADLRRTPRDCAIMLAEKLVDYDVQGE